MAETKKLKGTEVHINKNLMIEMRDGIKLATDIYFPSENGERLSGKLPSILIRTSYDKSIDSGSNPGIVNRYVPNYVSNGYVVLFQDLRGRHNSEGKGQYYHTANPKEGEDGYDTVEWIAAQSWSNGDIGTVGSSHKAMVQTHMALHDPPHLSAIWPDVGPTNNYAHQARWGGAMQLHMFGALFLHAYDAQEIEDDYRAQRRIKKAMENMKKWVYRTPFKKGQTPLEEVPNLEETLFDYYWRGELDDYWKKECNNYERHFEKHGDIPGTYSGGWFDPFAVATTRYYSKMQEKNRTTQRLIMGPWTHESMRHGNSYAGNVDFGSSAVWGESKYHDEQLRWFDRWLKGKDTKVDQEKPVLIFVMGGGSGSKIENGKIDHGGKWRREKDWPLPRTNYQEFYLNSDGNLTRNMPEEDDFSADFVYDPSRPVPTIGGNVTGFFELAPIGGSINPSYTDDVPLRARMHSVILPGPTHQEETPDLIASEFPYPKLSQRSDVLVFQTPPLEKDIEVTGHIKVKFWISSSATDTDFTAKLIDVHPPNDDYPGGYDMNLSDGIIRTRYREGWEEEKLMEPGQIYPIEIKLPPTSNIFQESHRIRVDISSSNFPRFDLNPNTGEPIGRHTHSIKAQNKVHLGKKHPSHVILPLVEDR